MAEAVLVNPNTIQPPIAPLGLEYLAEACRKAGVETRVVDLCFEADPVGALRAAVSQTDPRLVGLSLRNTDSCLFLSNQSYLPQFRGIVSAIRRATDAPICLGGAGFSVAPEAIMQTLAAEYGVLGDGEQAVPMLLKALKGQVTLRQVPGLLWREGGSIIRNASNWPPLSDQQGLRRDSLDNIAYFSRGGQLGLETKRGCDRSCIYCADSLGKGSRLRPRSPTAVADEMQRLLAQGPDVYHMCDSEFNIPERHAAEVCSELMRRGLGERACWYAYLSPQPFSDELAKVMQRAGCAGINFGADSGSDTMLARLGRDFSASDISYAVASCRRHGMATMIDLLIGAPGETTDTAAQTIRMAQQSEADCIGISLAVRLYAGTPLARQLCTAPQEHAPGIFGSLAGNPQLLEPVFYLSPQLGSPDEASAMLSDLIGGDERFFFGGSGDERDYDYDDNQVLVDAIAAGARGAYWDILRRRQQPEVQ